MLKLKTAIAANRFGLGAAPGDEGRIGADPAAWLEAQIDGGTAAAGAAAPRSRASGTTRASGSSNASVPGSAAVLAEVGELRLARQAAQSRRTGDPVEVDRGAIREFGQFIASNYQAQAGALYSRAIASEQPFRERLALFWANHFAVSAEKQPIGAIAGLYVDEAIRPHLAGNFRELLRAAIGHPAMLLYLDNQTSIGPNSALGRRANNGNRRAGLNENLAREILELHTLGVDGGYTQDDVIEFSKSLTGWSVGGEAGGNAARLGAMAGRARGAAPPDEPGGFVFRAAVHEPGSKTILGRRFAAGDQDEAEAVLNYLAMRPETSRFLATKLARHFVADTPPAALVDGLAATYLEHEGELAPVYRALIRAEASWREPLAKYKTPQEFLISAFRALGQSPPANQVLALATQLGQRPMSPGSPAGWPDIADHWTSGDALLKRIEWARTQGAGIGDRIDAVARLDEILGEVAKEPTRNGVRRAESGAQAITLLLAAPEFQRR